MLSGNNGVLQRATDAKEKTERATIIECAKTDILAQIAENKGESISNEQFKRVLNKYFVDVPNTLPEDLSDLDLISIDGEYSINAKEIYEGTLKKDVLIAGLYDENYILIKNWQKLLEDEDIAVSGTTITEITNKTIESILIIDNSITAIGDGGLAGCTNLKNIIMPNSIISIGRGGVASCNNLTDITISDNVISIGDSAFAGDSNLKKLKIPDKVTTLDRAVTGGCSNLEVLILGNGISNNIDANNFRWWITTFKDNSYRK